MKTADNKCFRCKHFDRYFTKGITRFDKTKIGWCCKKTKEVNINDGCNSYEHKSNKKIIKYAIRRQISDILTELSTIRNILEVDDNADDTE